MNLHAPSVLIFVVSLVFAVLAHVDVMSAITRLTLC